MKRIFTTLLVVAILVAALAVPAFAAAETESFTYSFVDDYETKIDDGNGQITFEFSPAGLGVAAPAAFTTMNMPTGATGRVLAYIAHYSCEARNANSNTVTNGKISCGIALQRFDNFATRTNHFALRNVNGEINSWDYTYTAPGHWDNSDCDYR